MYERAYAGTEGYQGHRRMSRAQKDITAPTRGGEKDREANVWGVVPRYHRGERRTAIRSVWKGTEGGRDRQTIQARRRARTARPLCCLGPSAAPLLLRRVYCMGRSGAGPAPTPRTDAAHTLSWWASTDAAHTAPGAREPHEPRPHSPRVRARAASPTGLNPKP